MLIPLRTPAAHLPTCPIQPITICITHIRHQIKPPTRFGYSPNPPKTIGIILIPSNNIHNPLWLRTQPLTLFVIHITLSTYATHFGYVPNPDILHYVRADIIFIIYLTSLNMRILATQPFFTSAKGRQHRPRAPLVLRKNENY